MAKEGHNSALTEEEQEALFHHHYQKLRQQEAKVAEQKAAYDAEKSAMTDLFRIAKTDGFTRKEMAAILADASASRRDLTAEEARRAQLRAWAGLPTGAQMDMFAALPQEAQDEQFFIGQGYAAGLRGDDREAPEEVPARFVQAHLQGWHDGQAKLAQRLNRAAEIIAARGISGDAEEGEGAPDEDGETSAEAETWADALMNGDDADFEASEDELSGQVGRRVHEDA